jgi:hypothetical protein
MTVRGTVNSPSTQEHPRMPQLVRGPGRRCDFCGIATTTAAVAAGGDPTQAVICPRCIERAALQLFRPGGGDAA